MEAPITISFDDYIRDMLGNQDIGKKLVLTIAKANAHKFSDAPQGFGAVGKRVDELAWELIHGTNDAQETSTAEGSVE